MPIHDYSSHTERIKVGTITEIQILADLTTIIKDFPIQDDQSFLPWFTPIDPTVGAVSEAKEFTQGLDASKKGFGGYTFSWTFGQLTPLMVKYLRDTFFASTLFSNDVTVFAFDRSYGWRAINCKAIWNDPATNADPKGLQGYQNLKIDFVKGVTASYGRAHSRAFSTAFG